MTTTIFKEETKMENTALPQPTDAEYKKRDDYYALFDKSLPSQAEDLEYLELLNNFDWSKED